MRERGYSFIVRLTLRSRPVLNAVILDPETGKRTRHLKIIFTVEHEKPTNYNMNNEISRQRTLVIFRMIAFFISVLPSILCGLIYEL